MAAGAQRDGEGQIMCVETARGHKRVYRLLGSSAAEGFDVTDDKAGCHLMLELCKLLPVSARS